MGAFPGINRNGREVDHSHPCSAEVKIRRGQGCTNPGWQVARATELRTAAPGFCVSSVWKWLHVVHLAPRILVWLLDFWKICALSGAVPLIPVYASRLRKGKFCFFYCLF